VVEDLSQDHPLEVLEHRLGRWFHSIRAGLTCSNSCSVVTALTSRTAPRARSAGPAAEAFRLSPAVVGVRHRRKRYRCGGDTCPPVDRRGDAHKYGSVLVGRPSASVTSWPAPVGGTGLS